MTFLANLKTEADQGLAQEQAEAHRRADEHSNEAQRKAAEASHTRFDAQTVARQQPHGAPKPAGVSWDDLIVAPELLEKLKTYCDVLRQAEAFKERGVTIPKGLLFYGPPGTGKTQTARVLAAQSGMTFVGCTTADIKQGWIGHSGQKVKEIFAQARASAPSILFIDELEAITNDLRTSPDTITCEIVGQLLAEIDGIHGQNAPVFVIGATNQPERINSALLSRFTEQIESALPCIEERKKLLDLLIGHRPLSPEITRTALLWELDLFFPQSLQCRQSPPSLLNLIRSKLPSNHQSNGGSSVRASGRAALAMPVPDPETEVSRQKNKVNPMVVIESSEDRLRKTKPSPTKGCPSSRQIAARTPAIGACFLGPSLYSKIT